MSVLPRKMNRKPLTLLILFLFFASMVAAQTIRMDSLSLKAYSHIMALRFEKAQKLLLQESNQYPDNVYVEYLKNSQLFLACFISEDKNRFNLANEGFDDRYDKITGLNDDNPYKQYLLSNMNLQWALLRLRFGQYFTAALEINRAYRQLTANKKRFPHFIPNQLSLGILHVILGLVPDQYQWMLHLVSMEGNVEQGKKEIYSVLDAGLQNRDLAYLVPEALFYLGFIELNLSPDAHNLERLMTHLDARSQQNLLLSFLKLDILMHHHQNEAALAFIKTIPRSKAYFPFYYLDYLKGDCLLRKLNPRAMDSYLYFLHHFKGNNYRKDAWLKCGWAALLEGDTLQYFQYLDSIQVDGAETVGADKAAQLAAERKTVPNLQLLKARLLYDGGYFIEAKKVLGQSDANLSKTDERLEWAYRSGRIEQAIHHLPEAKKFYTQCLSQGKNSPRYFAANAAFQMGQIYENQDSLAKAEQYYTICLELNFKEYRNSIRGKAKEALSRIQHKIDD